MWDEIPILSQMRTRLESCPTLCEHFRNHFPRHIRQPEIPALESVRQLRVLKAKQVQHLGVEIIHVNRIFDYVPADFIRLADYLPALHAAAGQPEREGEWMMIAARHRGGAGPVLAQRRAAKFR